jgi:hypothetical protein
MPKLVSNVVGSFMFCDNGLSGLLLQPLMRVLIKKTSMPTFGENYG